jgi:prolyl oligopeptidase
MLSCKELALSRMLIESIHDLGCPCITYCRVVPLHSLKLTAELQYKLAASHPDTSPQQNPLLIRVEVKAGHGAGKPTAKIIAETSDLLAFAAKCMGAGWRQ